MDRFKKNPEPFLRRSAKLSPSTELDTFKNYRAKTGHDSKYGKARLQAKITDLNTEVEIGQTESEQKPIVVMSARADKRFTHTLRPNIVDMNRAYKRRFLEESITMTSTRNRFYQKQTYRKTLLSIKDI